MIDMIKNLISVVFVKLFFVVFVFEYVVVIGNLWKWEVFISPNHNYKHDSNNVNFGAKTQVQQDAPTGQVKAQAV